MSETNDIKVKATALKTFFNEKGHKVKHTECVEAVSRIETGQCYNIAKNKAIRILKGDKTLTFKELKQNDFSVDVVIPIGLDTFMDGIEAVNDYASNTITGSEYALCSIGYEVYPYHYGQYEVAIRVTGYVEEIESLEHLEDYEYDFEDNLENTPEEKPIGYVLSSKELKDFQGNDEYEED